MSTEIYDYGLNSHETLSIVGTINYIRWKNLQTLAHVVATEKVATTLAFMHDIDLDIEIERCATRIAEEDAFYAFRHVF